MPENYIFWQRYSTQVDLSSITRPTRPPGRYTIEWDGKDDKGRAVPLGKYILNVEASREHGGHSVQRIDLNLGAAGFTGGAPAQDEIGATKVTFGKSP
jgi:thiamine biosynthesis lipoprotein